MEKKRGAQFLIAGISTLGMCLQLEQGFARGLWRKLPAKEYSVIARHYERGEHFSNIHCLGFSAYLRDLQVMETGIQQWRSWENKILQCNSQGLMLTCAENRSKSHKSFLISWHTVWLSLSELGFVAQWNVYLRLKKCSTVWNLFPLMCTLTGLWRAKSTTAVVLCRKLMTTRPLISVNEHTAQEQNVYIPGNGKWNYPWERSIMSISASITTN